MIPYTSSSFKKKKNSLGNISNIFQPHTERSLRNLAANATELWNLQITTQASLISASTVVSDHSQWTNQPLAPRFSPILPWGERHWEALWPWKPSWQDGSSRKDQKIKHMPAQTHQRFGKLKTVSFFSSTKATNWEEMKIHPRDYTVWERLLNKCSRQANSGTCQQH